MSTGSDFIDLVADAQREAFSAFQKTQELTLRAAELATRFVPAGGTLPNAREAVEATFGFAERVLELQKAVALQVADGMAAATERAQQAAASA